MENEVKTSVCSTLFGGTPFWAQTVSFAMENDIADVIMLMADELSKSGDPVVSQLDDSELLGVAFMLAAEEELSEMQSAQNLDQITAFAATVTDLVASWLPLSFEPGVHTVRLMFTEFADPNSNDILATVSVAVKNSPDLLVD